jgi:hypothetical protein
MSWFIAGIDQTRAYRHWGPFRTWRDARAATLRAWQDGRKHPYFGRVGPGVYAYAAPGRDGRGVFWRLYRRGALASLSLQKGKLIIERVAAAAGEPVVREEAEL